MERAHALDVDVFQFIEVGYAGLHVRVEPFVDAAHHLARELRWDERIVELRVRPIRCCAAVEVEADVVQFGGGFPGDEDGVFLRGGGEGGEGDGGGAWRAVPRGEVRVAVNTGRRYPGIVSARCAART